MSAGLQPFFGWLDYDERDAQRMREVFAAFDEKETIDSLGLGTIRDSISDQLFPGISTIQTRARYFLFVPWICQLLEDQAIPPARFARRLREFEVTLIESLRKEEDANAGVIGFRAGRRLSRLPSTVYWNGLAVFGIRLMNLSTAQYRVMASRLGPVRSQAERDDDGEPVTAVRRMWDPGLPAPPAGFPGEPIGLTLRREDSEYLASKFATRGAGTLIGELARDLTIDRTAELPWEIPLPRAPDHLAEVLIQGRNFAELMQGAQTLYNLLLFRRAGQVHDRDTSADQEWLAEELTKWGAAITERRSELRDWLSSDALWSVVSRRGRVRPRTQRFVLAWGELALADPAGIGSNPIAEALVVERELALKGRLARLTQPRALENWTGEPLGGGLMTFRWFRARQIVDDLANHEEA